MMTPLRQYAVMMHEFYVELKGAGFSEVQAVYLTAQRMRQDAER